ncbi:MAG: hypothetical protein AAFP76_09850 [Bacteroidota bacterium]
MATSKPANTTQKINLIDGCFSASEAAGIVNSILEVKINFHLSQRLARTKGDVSDFCEFDNSRMTELLAEQISCKEFFRRVYLEKKKLRMNSVIHISIEE